MSRFSDESQLIIRNWDAYQDIMKAGERLKTELSAVRSAIEGRLRKQGWWNPRWILFKNDPEQIAFTDSRWEIKDGHLIWVGVEGFKTDAVFGNAFSPPLMNVWIDGKLPEFKVELQRIIKASGKPMMGDFSVKQGYIVEKSLSTCLPEQIESFEDTAFAQLEEFCEFYARFFGEFDKAAQKHLKAGK